MPDQRRERGEVTRTPCAHHFSGVRAGRADRPAIQRARAPGHFRQSPVGRTRRAATQGHRPGGGYGPRGAAANRIAWRRVPGTVPPSQTPVSAPYRFLT